MLYNINITLNPKPSRKSFTVPFGAANQYIYAHSAACNLSLSTHAVVILAVQQQIPSFIKAFWRTITEYGA
jgi:hypothetical protein